MPPTVTTNVCAALRPPGSVAVTRIVAAPADTGVTMTRPPETDTAATCTADDVAPIGQRVAVRVPERPRDVHPSRTSRSAQSVAVGSTPAVTGGRFTAAGRSRHKAIRGAGAVEDCDSIGRTVYSRFIRLVGNAQRNAIVLLPWIRKTEQRTTLEVGVLALRVVGHDRAPTAGLRRRRPGTLAGSRNRTPDPRSTPPPPQSLLKVCSYRSCRRAMLCPSSCAKHPLVG